MAGGAPLGNRNSGRGTMFRDQITKIITQENETLPEKKRRLHRSAQTLLTQAAKGTEWALKELANRLDGKAIQGVELSDPNGRSLNFFDPANLRNLSEAEAKQLKDLLQKATHE